MRNELTLRCDCHSHYIDLDIYFDEDSYLNFHSRYGANNSWRSRLRTIWDILRGQRHLLDEVVLRSEEIDRLRMFLGTNANYTFSFAAADTASSYTVRGRPDGDGGQIEPS